MVITKVEDFKKFFRVNKISLENVVPANVAACSGDHSLSFHSGTSVFYDLVLLASFNKTSVCDSWSCHYAAN